MKFFISCGEVSGDIHASSLVRELRKFIPDATFIGIGGENLKKEGVEVFLDIKEMGVIGFVEAIKSLKKTISHLKLAEEKAKEADYCIFVDYPGFNLQLGKRTHRIGKKNIYYILPQVWAWGEKRIRTLKSHFDLLISIIPFEEDYFRKRGVTVHYVGSPVLDKVHQEREHIEEIAVPDNKKIIGILPGSRKSEVERLLPHVKSIMETMNQKRKDLFFILSRKIPYTLDGPPNMLLYDGHPYSIIKTADVLLVASGTATLETAIFEKPMVVFYKTSIGTYLAGRMVAKISHISLVNLIAGEEVVPE
ncbi:MAG: lipid-A-disaccharide synthase, partial [bacterium]|nr:lipid-A-disaccharide synthase [bacterium]